MYKILKLVTLKEEIKTHLSNANEKLLKNCLISVPQPSPKNVDVTKNFKDIVESELIEKFSKVIDAFEKERKEIPKYSCICCERLNFKHSVSKISKLKKFRKNEAWLEILAAPVLLYGDTDLENWYICEFCKDSLKKNQIPGRAVINGLITEPLPPEIECLNMYERFLIQKAKAFQMIVRLGTMSGNIPKSALVKAVKGRIIYLPLPHEENVKMFTSKFSEDRYLLVLVNGQPTKQKVIWQDIVDVEKVKKALCYLKEHNELYADINIDALSESIEDSLESSPSLLKTNTKTPLRKVSKAEEEEIVQHFSVHPLNSTNNQLLKKKT